MSNEPTTKPILHRAIDVADRASATALALLQDARAKLRARVDGGIERVEHATHAAFRLARKASERADEASAGALTVVEKKATNAFQSARGRAAARMATA